MPKIKTPKVEKRIEPIKRLEIKTYEHKGVLVRVKIDYENRRISLLDNQNRNKQWCFNDRGLEYMQGWQDIFSAMSYAVKEATEDLKNFKDYEDQKRIVDIAKMDKMIEDELREDIKFIDKIFKNK